MVVEPAGSPRDQLASVLRELGFHVVAVGDAQSAHGYLDALPRPALLIVGESRVGGEAAALLAEIARRPDAALLERVLWSAHHAPSVPPSDVRAVLSRPFELSALEAILERWRREVRPEASRPTRD